MTVLVDTDVLVDHLRKARPLPAALARGASCSVITRCELYAGSEEQEAAVEQLLGLFEIVDVDAAIAACAGRLRRRSGMRIADALIAATALCSGRQLATRNVRDFRAVSELELVSVD